MTISAVILAAGMGTRMKTSKPKVLHEIHGKSMIDYVLSLCDKTIDGEKIVVAGFGIDDVKEHVGKRASIAYQEKQLGTGHAASCGVEKLADNDYVIILCADTPLLKTETVEKMKESLKSSDAVVLISETKNPFNYGRIILDEGNNFKEIIEEKDLNEPQKSIELINSGVYMLGVKDLKNYISKLTTNNAQGEYYLTDVFSNMVKDGKSVSVVKAEFEEIIGVNDRKQLEDVRRIMQKRINEELMKNGVTIIDPSSVYIDDETTIGKDSIIYPGCFIYGSTIGENCIIGPNSYITKSTIENSVKIEYSYIEESIVNEHAKIGPYSHLRPNAKIGKNVKIGNFVEIKNASIGEGSKASHLAYVGDAEVGSKVNIGCGVIFVNYDGAKKYRSIIKDGAFIGSNSNVVAPVVIEEKGYVASGSTVTEDVPAGALCIARQRQVIKEGWVEKKKIFEK